MMRLMARSGDVNIDGAKVRRMREDQALTLKELAERTGLDIATLSRLENERRPARITTVRKLADALGVEPRELIKR